MARGEQSTYQSESLIKLIAKNGKDMIIDPKTKENTPTTMCWPIEEHSDQLSWDSTMYSRELKDELRGQSWFNFSSTTRKLGGKLF